jgi:hypothetical protein
MEWGNLTVAALAVSAAALFLRWRFPAVPTFVATGGFAVSFCVALFSVFNPSVPLALSLSLNVGLTAVALEYWKTKGRVSPESKRKDERRLALRAIAAGRTKAAIARNGRSTIVDFQHAIPHVRAAILTAHKHFGTPVLPESGEVSRDVEDGGELDTSKNPVILS